MPNPELLGYVCCGSKFGLATLVALDHKIRGLGVRGEMYSFFGAVFVMAVFALDCKKALDVCETFILNVTKFLREGRRAGAKDFHITRDLNVELGLLCADEDDIDELSEMYGHLRWQGCENDHGGLKKLEGIQLQGHLHVVHSRK